MLLTPFVATAEDEATQDFVAKFEEVASETPTSSPPTPTTASTR